MSVSGTSRRAPALAIAAGLLAGLTAFNLRYAHATSYLRDDPAACANCHAMSAVYDSWRKGSHHRTATCNDCHTPAGVVPKYASKALNGFFHSWAFTLNSYPDNIQITPRNRAIAERSCLKCHAELTGELRAVHAGNTNCLRCHNTVGHQH